ncbi:MAG: hypothetical protein POG74_05305 [Acidocella sp.]|nr:hypothetical protein [Acidocella sp.]
MIASLVTSGDIIVPILILTMFEAAGLALLYHFTKHGVVWRDFLPNLLAGDFLLAAWWLSAKHHAWPFVAAALLLSFVCHLFDLARRWRKRA